MGSRHQERKRALELLYQADLRGRRPSVLLDTLERGEEPPEAFTASLVRGVEAHREQLDAVIATYARNLTLDRMPVLDRNILRLALYELGHTDVPSAVAINEAVELASDLSTDDSGRYINGILSRAAEQDPRPQRMDC